MSIISYKVGIIFGTYRIFIEKWIFLYGPYLRGVELRVGCRARVEQTIIIESMKLLTENMKSGVSGNNSRKEGYNKKGAYLMMFVSFMVG